MKRVQIISLFTLLSFNFLGQTNLLLNGSFELFSECPATSSLGIGAAMNWSNPTSYSPDYYNICDSQFISTGDPNYLNRGVPYNIEGFQNARTGDAYAGIITYAYTTGDEREYIQSILIDSLTSGQTYHVSFFVSTGDSSPFISNNIGVFFSKTPITNFGSSTYLPYLPQISNDPQTNPLTDKTGWTEVSGEFIAQGGEKYITIGNFNNNATTDTTNFSIPPTWENYGYHFIDDVSISISTNLNKANSVYSDIILYPNPSNGIVNIKHDKSNIKKLNIYNLFGELITSIDCSTSKNIKIDLSNLQKGIYMINLTTSFSNFIEKLILTN